MLIGNLEISQNLEYLITLPGFGKILTLVSHQLLKSILAVFWLYSIILSFKVLTLIMILQVFGVIGLGLGGYSYETNLNYWEEDVYLECIAFFVAVSLIYLIAHAMIYDLVINRINKIIVSFTEE